MPVHVNSREALQRLKNGDQLTDVRWQVYDLVQRLGAMTSNEVHEILYGAQSGGHRNNAGARLLELELMGLIKRGDSRTCRISGRRCLTWSAVQTVPQELGPATKEPRYTKETLPARCQRLEAELQAMTEKCLRLAHLQGVDDL